MKNSKYVKINSLKPLYLIVNKANGYLEEINKNKYLALVSTIESKIIKNKKYKDLVRSITKNLDDCDENYTRIKFNSDDDSPLNETIEIHNVTVVARVIFHEKSSIIHKFS